tara:strand:- start:12131 stop:12397 length:267 start_codon:yes stop_codon:yes gene_type:complete
VSDNKLPLKSKKFIAYLIAEAGWKILLIWILIDLKSKFDHYSFIVILTLVIVSGFIQVGYILGQAALDKYTYLTEKAMDQEKEEKKNV